MKQWSMVNCYKLLQHVRKRKNSLCEFEVLRGFLQVAIPQIVVFFFRGIATNARRSNESAVVFDLYDKISQPNTYLDLSDCTVHCLHAPTYSQCPIPIHASTRYRTSIIQIATYDTELELYTWTKRYV